MVREGVSKGVTCGTPGPLHEAPPLLSLSLTPSPNLSCSFFFHSFSKYELRPYYVPGLGATANPALIRELSARRGDQHLSKPMSTGLSGQTPRSSWIPLPLTPHI